MRGLFEVEDRCRELRRQLLLEKEYLDAPERHTHVVALLVVDDYAEVTWTGPRRWYGESQAPPGTQLPVVENTLEIALGVPGDRQNSAPLLGLCGPDGVIVAARYRRDELVSFHLP